MSKRKSSLLHDVFTGQGALPIAAVLALVLGLTTSAFGGSIFVTGHDSDFHALQGPMPLAPNT